VAMMRMLRARNIPHFLFFLILGIPREIRGTRSGDDAHVKGSQHTSFFIFFNFRYSSRNSGD